MAGRPEGGARRHVHHTPQVEIVDPTPAARAAFSAKVAIAVSCAPVPVRSQMVIWSPLCGRPGPR